jgi:Bacterial inner membrane protein
MTFESLFAESVGWIATAVVGASFFFDSPTTLRKVQIAGALLWLAYGVVIGSLPVVVANMFVFAAATWSLVRMRRSWAPANATAGDPAGI